MGQKYIKEDFQHKETAKCSSVLLQMLYIALKLRDSLNGNGKKQRGDWEALSFLHTKEKIIGLIFVCANTDKMGGI